jgi:4-amino-4-deoxy-L-arabinose transferase-like glycosyltransferase
VARAATTRAKPAVAARLDLVLVAIVALGIVLRVWGLGSQSFWYDEWLTTRATAGSFADALRHTTHREVMPPTYFVIMWGWAKVFGNSEFALRSFSALAGIATIPVAYFISRELGCRRATARAASLLVAVSPMLVYYSQEARPYTLLSLVGALSVLMFARAYRRGSSRDYLGWGLACAAALAVHYFAAFLVVAEVGAFVLLRRSQVRLVLRACIAPAVVLGLLLPVLYEQHSHATNYNWVSSFRLSARVREAGRAALVGPNPPDHLAAVIVAIICGIAVVLLLWRGERSDRRAAGLMAGLGATAVALPLLLVPFGLDVVLSRYLIAALVPLAVAVAIGLTVRRAGWVGSAGIAVLCAASLFVVVADARDPMLQRPDWSAVAHAFDTGSSPNRLLLMNVHGLLGSPLQYYEPHARVLGTDDQVAVDEIDVVYAKPTKRPCNLFVGRACSLIFLGAPLPPEVGSEFHVERRFDLDQFEVVRYRADHPVALSTRQLVPDNPGDASTLAVTQK